MKKVTYIIKISSSKSEAVAINSFFSISSTYFVIIRVLAIIYNLHLSLWLIKLTLILLRVRKTILRRISIYREIIFWPDPPS